MHVKFSKQDTLSTYLRTKVSKFGIVIVIYCELVRGCSFH